MRFVLTCIWIAFSAHAYPQPNGRFDWHCETPLTKVTTGARELLADFVRLPSGGELFVRVEEPIGGVTKKWIIAWHGLLESHQTFGELSERLIAAGYGVARPDLRGFARSLHRRHPIDGVITHRVAEQDMDEIIEHLRSTYGISQPRLIGHSMGGGLEVPLLSRPKMTERLDGRHVLINPFIYRTDRYLAKKAHLALPEIFEWWSPSYAILFSQMWTDFWVDSPMRPLFTKYLAETALHTRELDLRSERVQRALADQVSVAIGAVKGLSGLNCVTEIDRIPKSLRVDMIYGDQDTTVEPEHSFELAERIERRGGVAKMISAGHHIPTRNVDELFEFITVGD